MPLLGGLSDLSAKRTSENLNTLGVWGLASQRSFLRKTNKYIHLTERVGVFSSVGQVHDKHTRGTSFLEGLTKCPLKEGFA